jgi:hypothetical protein
MWLLIDLQAQYLRVKHFSSLFFVTTIRLGFLAFRYSRRRSVALYCQRGRYYVLHKQAYLSTRSFLGVLWCMRYVCAFLEKMIIPNTSYNTFDAWARLWSGLREWLLSSLSIPSRMGQTGSHWGISFWCWSPYKITLWHLLKWKE